MSDQDESGRAKQTWGAPEQNNPQPQYSQPMAPPPQPYGGQPSYGGPPPGYYPPQKSNKGLIIGLASALGVLLLVGIILLIVWLSGGFGRSSSSYSASNYSSSSNSSTGAVTADWLSRGYWKDVSCASETSTRFDSGGSMVGFNGSRMEYGSWTLTGSTLSMSGRRGSVTMTVSKDGENAMRVSNGGRTETLYRCSAPGPLAQPGA